MKQKTEILLCKAFMELMKKYPFPKITIQKIASECGVNRQTFYYHFDNIYDLMATAFEYELVHECRMYDGGSWEDVMKRFLKWMKENRVIIKNILTNIESRYLRQVMYPLIIRSMENKYRPNTIIRQDTGIDAFWHMVSHSISWSGRRMTLRKAPVRWWGKCFWC